MNPSLVADIGGTHARFALVDAVDSAGAVQGESVLAVAAYPDAAAALAAYLASLGVPALAGAALAIAGPVGPQGATLTNAGWRFEPAALAAQLRVPASRVLLLNDFEALALALPTLATAELRQVGGGGGLPEAPKALLGPGTGLGVSGLVKAGEHWLPLAGEGGHVTLPPADEREAALLALARREFPHVSAERLVSGSGLPLLHRLVGAVDGRAGDRSGDRPPGPTGPTVTPPETPLDASLDAPAIVAGALAGDAACAATIATFCALLGTVAGNLALTLGARGGVYIGGGIVPRLGRLFDASPFRARFEAKGRFVDYLAAIPVHVILAASPALRGAAQALRQRSIDDR